MTPEEHTARAMLLGRIYIQWANVYVLESEWNSTKIGVPDSWLDADTLEVMPQDKKMDRLLGKVQLPADDMELEVPEWQRN